VGTNNKQRRAAKRKGRHRSRTAASEPLRETFVPTVTPEMASVFVVGLVEQVEVEPHDAAACAALLLRPDGPVPPVLGRQALSDLRAGVVARLVQNGWRPSDLAQIARRQCGDDHVPGLLDVLAHEARRHRRVAAAWLDDLAAAGAARPLDLRVLHDVRRALELTAHLARLPAIAELLPPPGRTERAGSATGPSGTAADSKPLARVRALLAKAESTEFPEEAELLSAKAQDLISRHALAELLSAPERSENETAAQRIWIDAPYVSAKSMLIHHVSLANRSRSVIAESLGFCTVIGRPGDLAAIELFVTSLLVQSSVAMRRHGAQADWSGTSRTRSFRQSFLISYAARIGERLHEADAQAAQDSGRPGELVPLLKRTAEQVDEAMHELFPEMIAKQVNVNHAGGWAAGRAAADLAHLGVADAVAG